MTPKLPSVNSVVGRIVLSPKEAARARGAMGLRVAHPLPRGHQVDSDVLRWLEWYAR